VWLCFLTPIFSFPAGVWLAERLSRLRIRAKAKDRRPSLESLPVKRTLLLSAACLLIGVAVLGYEYHLIGGIPALSDNPDAMRMQLFGVAGQGDAQFDTLFVKLVHPFVEFSKYAVFLTVILFAQRQLKTRASMCVGLLLIAGGICAYGSQGSRTSVVQIAIVALAMWHYVRQRIRLRHLSIAVASTFLFVALYGAFRIQKSASAPLFEKALAQSGFPQGALGSGLAFGYATVTISFEVFDHLVDDLDSVQRPAHGFLFYSLHRFIPRSNLQEFAFDLYSGESITPTFLGEFYGDYGLSGVIIGTLLLGLAYGWVYSKATVGLSTYELYTYAIFVQLLIFVPYVNLFSEYITWILDLAFMYLLLRACRQSSRGCLTPA